ncbi:MAG: squalene/phytoene synthase family protein [Verrucomicrobiota bacterium]|nr:squalene/phytoene synthase family protein [Verrucomicrobiota bacterium]
MDAKKITRRSKSNLALAFVSLGKERRRDITTFYAFCRLIDDIADSTQLSIEEKSKGLCLWRKAFVRPSDGEDVLASEVRALIAKYQLTPAMLEEIITGVEMDLRKVRYANFAELRLYCYRVASAVGLVSVEIFGYKNPRCKEYAIDLGLALQTTNIIRDVGKDMRSGRIYLPQDEIARCGYSEAELLRGETNKRFTALMEFQAQRSDKFYDSAAALLPPEDRASMVAAEIMGAVYRKLLHKIEADRFRVFEKDYRLNRVQKTALIAAQFFRRKERAGI